MERVNRWKTYTDEQLEEVEKVSSRYKSCLDAGKTERESVSLAADMAKEAGYKDLAEYVKENAELKCGDKVYVNQMGKALALFQIGEEPLERGMNILGAHVDSPRLDVKQNPLYEESELAYLDTHYYGGIKKYQWAAIPLALHGTVAKKDGTTVDITIGEKEDDPVLVISDLLIHLAGEQMEKKASVVIEGEVLDVLVGSRPLVGEEKEEEKKDDAEVLDKDGNPITNTGDAAASDHTADGSDTSADSEKDERKVIYYVTDKVQQGQYIKLFKEQNMQAVILDHNIDTSFITQLEQRNEKYKFMRIDADVTESLKDETSAEDLKAETDALTEVFKKALNNDKLTVKVEKLKNENISSIITLSEEGRRMQDMMKMYAMNGMGGMDMNMFAADQTLTLNANNELVKYIFEHKDSENVPMFCEQLYDLAVLSNHPLSVDEMTKFVERSNKIMMLLAK